MNATSLPYYAPFRAVVERLFNSWTGLQLAVEHGMGGNNGRNMAIQMIDYVTEYCCGNESIDVQDLITALDEIMDEEFETLCQDNSTHEIAHLLVRYITLCRSNMLDQMISEVSQLPPCKLWLCKPHIQYTMPIQPNEIIHDDDDDDADENEGDKPHEEAMEEDVEPGWTVVRTKKK